MFKSFIAAAALSLGTVTASAQKEVSYPHIFVGLQGGAQTTLTSSYNNFKLITPTASVSLGAWFTPVVGARLNANGIWNKGGIKYTNALGPQDNTYDYRTATGDLDLLINLVTLFGKKDYYPVNVNLIGGVGLNGAWNNDDAYALKEAMPLAWNKSRLSHNARVGVQLDCNVARNLSVNLEVDANNLNDRYNSKNTNKDDWSLTAQVGLAYKFGKGIGKLKSKRKKDVGTDAMEPLWETRIDTTWYEEPVYSDVQKEEVLKKNIHFAIRESDCADNADLKAVATFVKSHKDCKVTVDGYADVGTGNPRINMGYSQQRAEKATKYLIEQGVDPSQITTAWHGDTIQPFADNDLNRVAITVAAGKTTVREKTGTTKKFTTKETRYRVR